MPEIISVELDLDNSSERKEINWRLFCKKTASHFFTAVTFKRTVYEIRRSVQKLQPATMASAV